MKISEGSRKLKIVLAERYEENEAENISKIFWEDLFNYKGGLDRSLHTKELVVFRNAIDKLEAGWPIQYVTNVAFFYNYKFHVNENVLIPRPETEELVYQLLSECRDGRVLDIGTGSGCIAISVKCRRPGCEVDAIDISSAALEVAKTNAEKNEAGVKFLQLDFLNEDSWFSLVNYDNIISNPPYISEEEKEHMSASTLDHEPNIALFPNDDNILIFYEKIAKFGSKQLNAGGSIYLECNEFNAHQVKEIFEKANYPTVKLVKDMQGKDRILVARKATA